MAKFSSPESQGQRQSASVMKELQGQGNVIESVGTVRNYEQALRNVATELARNDNHLRDMKPEDAKSYLENRASEVGQKSLDMERQAIQCMMQNVTNQLSQDERLDVVKSDQQQVLESRSYTSEQIKEIAQHQAPQNALATQIAHAAGLRAHELYTLEKADVRPADDRPALNEKFSEREGQIYTVEGKGGLTREVLIPTELAQQLEDRRLDQAIQVTDRGIHYEQNYNIGAGRAFSQSFSRASENALEFSNGAHGLRHSYAQERMDELRASGLEREHALEIVSQEMGHFRADITEVYLR